MQSRLCAAASRGTESLGDPKFISTRESEAFHRTPPFQGRAHLVWDRPEAMLISGVKKRHRRKMGLYGLRLACLP